MLRFATDENFNGNIVRILLMRLPGIDLVRIQDTLQYGKDDRDVLAWCADEDRILISHDIATLKTFAYERVDGGLRMPGVLLCDQYASPRIIADEIVLIELCSTAADWAGNVWYLPL